MVENSPFRRVKFHLVFSPHPEYYNNCQQGSPLYKRPGKNPLLKKKEKLIMKKLTALALAGCMAVSLAACGRLRFHHPRFQRGCLY